ncbi:hypothetical protein BKA63DRAFT_594495, partial [Paraphoma chrysanthemicola]
YQRAFLCALAACTIAFELSLRVPNIGVHGDRPSKFLSWFEAAFGGATLHIIRPHAFRVAARARAVSRLFLEMTFLILLLSFVRRPTMRLGKQKWFIVPGCMAYRSPFVRHAAGRGTTSSLPCHSRHPHYSGLILMSLPGISLHIPRNQISPGPTLFWDFTSLVLASRAIPISLVSHPVSCDQPP